MIKESHGSMNDAEITYNFIVIEGNIGSGKTSLATKLAEDFNAKLVLEQFEDNSFLPKFYNDKDRYALPLELSFLAERYQQLKENINTIDMFQNKIVADYIINKSLIFARKTLNMDEFKLYHNLFNMLNQNIVKPDLLVYLHSDVEKLQDNIRKRGRVYEQNIDNEYLLEIQNSYFDFLKENKDLKILIIDSNNIDFVNNKEDYLKLKLLLKKEYTTGINTVRMN